MKLDLGAGFWVAEAEEKEQVLLRMVERREVRLRARFFLRRRRGMNDNLNFEQGILQELPVRYKDLENDDFLIQNPSSSLYRGVLDFKPSLLFVSHLHP